MKCLETKKEYRKKIVSGNFEYTFQLATPEYMVCKEFADSLKNLPVLSFNKRLSELKGYVFFIINIEKAHSSNSTLNQEFISSSEKQELLAYYQQIASNDISLITNKDELKPSVWNFEDNYGLSPYNTIVAGFKKDLVSISEPEMILVFNDRYTHTPKLKVSYTKDEIKNIPLLTIK